MSQNHEAFLKYLYVYRLGFPECMLRNLAINPSTYRTCKKDLKDEGLLTEIETAFATKVAYHLTREGAKRVGSINSKWCNPKHFKPPKQKVLYAQQLYCTRRNEKSNDGVELAGVASRPKILRPTLLRVKPQIHAVLENSACVAVNSERDDRLETLSVSFASTENKVKRLEERFANRWDKELRRPDRTPVLNKYGKPIQPLRTAMRNGAFVDVVICANEHQKRGLEAKLQSKLTLYRARAQDPKNGYGHRARSDIYRMEQLLSQLEIEVIEELQGVL